MRQLFNLIVLLLVVLLATACVTDPNKRYNSSSNSVYMGGGEGDGGSGDSGGDDSGGSHGGGDL